MADLRCQRCGGMMYISDGTAYCRWCGYTERREKPTVNILLALLVSVAIAAVIISAAIAVLYLTGNKLVWIPGEDEYVSDRKDDGRDHSRHERADDEAPDSDAEHPSDMVPDSDTPSHTGPTAQSSRQTPTGILISASMTVPVLSCAGTESGQ